MVVALKNTVLRNVTPCSLINNYWCPGGPSVLCLDKRSRRFPNKQAADISEVSIRTVFCSFSYIYWHISQAIARHRFSFIFIFSHVCYLFRQPQPPRFNHPYSYLMTSTTQKDMPNVTNPPPPSPLAAGHTRCLKVPEVACGVRPQGASTFSLVTVKVSRRKRTWPLLFGWTGADPRHLGGAFGFETNTVLGLSLLLSLLFFLAKICCLLARLWNRLAFFCAYSCKVPS